MEANTSRPRSVAPPPAAALTSSNPPPTRTHPDSPVSSMRLATISETGPPPLPPQSTPSPPFPTPSPAETHTRSSNSVRLFHLPFVRSSKGEEKEHLPRFSAEGKPPSYATETDLWGRSSNEEKLAMDSVGDGRGGTRSRGGWKRIGLVALLAMIFIIALAVGLGVGLTRRSKSDGSTSAGSDTGSVTTTRAFPLGSWSLTTFLSSTSTSCTTNALTWTCYPYVIYNTSTTASLATFDFVITNSSSSSSNGNTTYQISSSSTLTSIAFTNATLSLESEGTDTEHYVFSTSSIVKQDFPSTSLSADGSTDVCFFNSTILTGVLYTKMAKTYPLSSDTANSTTTGTGTTSFEPWPYAVQVSQTAQGGTDVPNCYKYVNGAVEGSQIELGVESADEECSCIWQDYGT